MSGHKSKSQKMDLIYVQTSQNIKIRIIYVQFWTPQRTKYGYNYVRTQVKIAKEGFELRPDTSQNRKRWISFMSGHKSKLQNMAIMSDG